MKPSLRVLLIALLTQAFACVGPTTVTINLSLAPGASVPSRVFLSVADASGGRLLNELPFPATGELVLPGTIVLRFGPAEETFTIVAEGRSGGATTSTGIAAVTVRPHRNVDLDLELAEEVTGDAGTDAGGTDAGLDSGTDALPFDSGVIAPSMACAGGAPVIVVTTRDDELDDPAADGITDVGGPGDVSLREAMTIANNLGVPFEIRFDVALFNDLMTNRIDVGAGSAGAVELPALTGGGVCIDGLGTFVVISGALLAGQEDGFKLHSASNVLANLIISGFPDDGVRIDTAAGNDNIITSCHLGSSAISALGHGDNGLVVSIGANNVIGPGNVFADNGGHGLSINLGATGTIVRGNIFGQTAGGNSHPNVMSGIHLDGAGVGTIIGGSLPAQSNLIANSGDHGMLISNGSTGAVIEGNYIGVSAIGTQVGNGNEGIHVADATGIVIGPGNVIKHNADDGIALEAPASGITITENIIADNGDLPMQFAPGANAGVTSPIITTAGPGIISGTSDPGTVELFAGNGGDMECYLGATAVFGMGWGIPVPAMPCGPDFVATRTDMAGNTSVPSPVF